MFVARPRYTNYIFVYSSPEMKLLQKLQADIYQIHGCQCIVSEQKHLHMQN